MEFCVFKQNVKITDWRRVSPTKIQGKMDFLTHFFEFSSPQDGNPEGFATYRFDNPVKRGLRKMFPKKVYEP